MMIPSTTPIVLDSTVIIALSTVGRVDLLRWRVLIPEELRKKALFIPGDKEETGDSDVIATVLELKDVLNATDDRRLRKVCKILGAKVTGTIGIYMKKLSLLLVDSRKHPSGANQL